MARIASNARKRAASLLDSPARGSFFKKQVMESLGILGESRKVNRVQNWVLLMGVPGLLVSTSCVVLNAYRQCRPRLNLGAAPF